MGQEPEGIVPNDKDYNVEAQVANPHSQEKHLARNGEPEVLHRELKSRHASMLALGGAIGTGLIIASGGGLAQAGPVGLLIAFIFVGSLCFAMLACLGEMSAFLPHQTGFTGHATRFVGASFGACTGFSYWLKYLLQTPAQFAACTVIMNFWVPSSKVNNGVWMAIFILVTFGLQMMPVRFFGEFEFWCSTIKVITLTGLMIMCLVIDAGGGPNHDYLGFRTWKQLPFVEYLVPGATGRFVGFWTALITAVYSYTGSEMIGIALGEMSNPRKNVTRAVRACFYRIVFLYCGSIFCIGLVVPANSPLLLEANKNSTNASASPFVVAANVAGIKVLPHIINAAALIFVLSAANSDIYVNSRTAFSLAEEGNLPKIFATTNRLGVPYFAVTFTSIFSCIGFMVCSNSAYSIFKYLVSAVTLVSTVVWMQIMWSHLRFMKACKLHGIERKQLPYANRMNPYMAWYGLIGTGLISLTKGFTAFIKGFHVIPFVTNYVALPVIVLSYIFYAWRYGSWFTPIDQLDLSSEVRALNDDQAELEESRVPVKRSVWGWIVHAWNS